MSEKTEKHFCTHCNSITACIFYSITKDDMVETKCLVCEKIMSSPVYGKRYGPGDCSCCCDTVI